MDKETRAHNRVLAEYQRRMQDILDRYSRDMSRLAGAVQADPDRPFAFSDYPPLKDRHAAMLAEMRSLMVSQVEDAVRQEWGRADRKNDALAVSVIGSEEGAAALGYIRRNTDALGAFMTRKTAGMDLSGRVWDITGQFDTQVQDAIDTALLDGKSADELSREVRNLLHNPDELFRRVRDNRGLLHLSRNAKAYHPGQGVYRSAYMNARRMAATEINMAYRTADHLRVQQMDFVVGIEVHLSGNHNCKGVPPGQFVDICDELQGRYPKDFKFTGWHPFCRCYATTVLKTRQEMKEDAARIRNGEKPSEGSVNSVDTLPEGFTKWVDRNQQRIATARTLPYFLRDNGQINADGVWEPFGLSPDKTAQSSYKHETLEQLRQRLGDDLPKTLEHLDQATEYFIDEVGKPDYVIAKNYGDKARRYASEIEEVMAELFEKHSYGMYIKEEDLERIFRDGKFRNQFETGTSGGFVSKFTDASASEIDRRNIRLRHEHEMFMPYRSVSDQLRRDEYVKYGLILDRNIEKSIAENHAYNGQYGTIEVRFRKDKVVTTWTAGDSLTGRYQPSLTSDPKAVSYGNTTKIPRRGTQTENLDQFIKEHTKKRDYIELQYHGQLTLDDVESIVFPFDITESKLHSVARQMQQRGIKVYHMLDDKIQEFDAAAKRTPTPYQTTALTTPNKHDEIKAKRANTLEWGKKNIIGKLTYTNPAFGGKTAKFTKNSFTENLGIGGALEEAKIEILTSIEQYLTSDLEFRFETITHGTGGGFYKAVTKYKGNIEEFKGRDVELQFKITSSKELQFHFIKLL